MAKKQTTKDLRKKPRSKDALTVLVDAPSGEGKPMQIRTVMTQKALLKALEENRGHIKRSCEAVGIDRDTYYEYMKDVDFKRAVDNLKEGKTDDYVDALDSIALDAKFFPAVKYYLDNHAQDRGFGREVKAQEEAAKNKSVQVANTINLATLPVEVLKQLKAASVKEEK